MESAITPELPDIFLSDYSLQFGVATVAIMTYISYIFDFFHGHKRTHKITIQRTTIELSSIIFLLGRFPN